jgi:hypothetical protein
VDERERARKSKREGEKNDALEKKYNAIIQQFHLDLDIAVQIYSLMLNSKIASFEIKHHFLRIGRLRNVFKFSQQSWP